MCHVWTDNAEFSYRPHLYVYRTLLIYPFLHMFVFTIKIVVECCVQMFNTKHMFCFNRADFQSVRFVTHEHAV